MFKTYEQAQEEVEKLRQELYPNLYSASGTDGEDVSNLQTISEDTAELTDTNNEYTEDTSEAYASDDEIRVRLDDDLENEGEFKSDQDEDVCSIPSNIHPQITNH